MAFDWTDYIRQAAALRGIDPNIALRVARSEGGTSGHVRSGYSKDGHREPSYGPFQLLLGGPGTGFPEGMGNQFMRTTGLDPRDPSNGGAMIDFALDQAASKGWGQWYGAAKSGIGPRDGIGGEARALGSSGTVAAAPPARANSTPLSQQALAQAMGKLAPNPFGFVDPMKQDAATPAPTPAPAVTAQAPQSGGILSWLNPISSAQAGEMTPDAKPNEAGMAPLDLNAIDHAAFLKRQKAAQDAAAARAAPSRAQPQYVPADMPYTHPKTYAAPASNPVRDLVSALPNVQSGAAPASQVQAGNASDHAAVMARQAAARQQAAAEAIAARQGGGTPDYVPADMPYTHPKTFTAPNSNPVRDLVSALPTIQSGAASPAQIDAGNQRDRVASLVRQMGPQPTSPFDQRAPVSYDTPPPSAPLLATPPTMGMPDISGPRMPPAAQAPASAAAPVARAALTPSQIQALRAITSGPRSPAPGADALPAATGAVMTSTPNVGQVGLLDALKHGFGDSIPQSLTSGASPVTPYHDPIGDTPAAPSQMPDISGPRSPPPPRATNWNPLGGPDVSFAPPAPAPAPAKAPDPMPLFTDWNPLGGPDVSFGTPKAPAPAATPPISLAQPAPPHSMTPPAPQPGQPPIPGLGRSVDTLGLLDSPSLGLAPGAKFEDQQPQIDAFTGGSNSPFGPYGPDTQDLSPQTFGMPGATGSTDGIANPPIPTERPKTGAFNTQKFANALGAIGSLVAGFAGGSPEVKPVALSGFSHKPESNIQIALSRGLL
jgi:hypothetical protein